MVRKEDKPREKQLPKNKLEKWSDVVRKKKLDLSKPSNIVLATEIKDVVGEEARLMAKIDKEEDLPSIFKEYGVFILALDRHSYAIVKGKGYHKLESVESSVETYSTNVPFPTAARGVESESTYLIHAYSTGLLGHFTNVKDLHIATYGQRNTPPFDCYVSGINLKNIRAQIEIDGVFESEEQIVLVEAKMGIPSSFMIRQLYYPYRALYSDSNSKSIRNIFFCYERLEQVYRFYEYDFEYPKQYDSIRFVKSGKYKIHFKPEPIKKYLDVSRDEAKLAIPQADDLDKIIQFPFCVAEGIDTARKVAMYFGFAERQSSYYRDAAEILGLVKSNKKKTHYYLTDKGEQFIKLPTLLRTEYFCKLLLEFPVINQVFVNVSSSHDKPVTKNEIIEMLRLNSKLGGTTLGRRADTILAWFRWIQHYVGLVEVSKDKIWFSRQQKLEL